MQIQIVPHEGWQNAALLSNAHVELVVTLDVGPRVIAYRTPGGTNVLKTFPEELGGSGEDTFKLRGGHRLWVAPEGDACYVPDNVPVKHELLADGVRVESTIPAPWNLRKILTLTLDENSSRVTAHHRVVNQSDKPATFASWALTIMAPGGLEIIPVPPLGEHPRDLLPSRVMVQWPYTDLADPRWRFGTEFITLRQTEAGPTKMGFLHTAKWTAYLNGETLFVKRFEVIPGAVYPDFGCNYETFSRHDLLEMETLGPLKTLQSGEAVEHVEEWFLAGDVTQPASLHEQDLGDWIEPILERLGV